MELGELGKETAEEYLRLLESFFDKFKVRTHEDLEKALRKRNYAKNLCKALRKFYTFLKKRNIISRDEYELYYELTPLKKTRKEKAEPKPKDHEIAEAWRYHLEHSDEVIQLYFKILVFSGARLKAIQAMLEEFDPDRVEVHENFIKYHLGRRLGKKSTPFIYMPKELLQELRKVKKIKYGTLHKKVAYKKVSARSIRGWFATFLSRRGVKDHVIKFIIGQVGQTVLEEHYLDLEFEADEAYSRVVDELKNVLEVGG
ncbi:integrase [Thermococcus sp. SY098]|uniref:integrase n=1 Tax=Thermococcus sp. SY098 TaxID=3111325 RepID=UPI002D777328|nr:integrase [Thermococcus sp. SY098]WRS51843.1 integrase [Thermococcus sp. SY098]